MSLADDILSVDDRPTRAETAWGKQVIIKPMSGTDRDSYDTLLHEAKKEGKRLESFRAHYLVRCLFDADGNRIFANDQAASLGEKNADTISRLFDIAIEIGKSAPDAIADAAKNS